MSQNTNVSIPVEDLYEIACACHAAMAQDSPYSSEHYFTTVLGLAMGPMPRAERNRLEVFLAEKEYLPPVSIELAK